MWSTCDAVGGSSHAIRASVLAKNPRSALISSPRARSTAIMVSTSAIVASSITPGLATDCAANRWKTFLSNISRTAAAYWVRHDRPRFDRREVVARARSRLGERSYRILTNNCEHFCEWCLNGASRSTQVERWLSGARRFACALLGTLGLAAGTPTFADPASQLAARVVGEGPTIHRSGCRARRHTGCMGRRAAIDRRELRQDVRLHPCGL